jgi:hypothetical protein
LPATSTFKFCAPSDHFCKHELPAGHKALSAKSFLTWKQRQYLFSCGLRNPKLTYTQAARFL